jgi:hypothetical protein
VEVLRSRGLGATVLGTVLEGGDIIWRGVKVEGITWDYTSGRIVVE